MWIESCLGFFLDKGHRANDLTQVAVPEKSVKSSETNVKAAVAVLRCVREKIQVCWNLDPRPVIVQTTTPGPITD